MFFFRALSARSFAVKKINVTWILPNQTEVVTQGFEGDSLLQVAQANDIDIEGACESQMACSTCHVILEPHVFDQLPEAWADEEDMLDIASCVTDTSRLGCQVLLDKEIGDLKVELPDEVDNFYE